MLRPKALHLPAPMHKRKVRRSMILLPLGLLVVLTSAWALLDPSLLPQAADAARAVVGPGPVAQVEAWTFGAQDAARQARYQVTGGASQLQWAAPATTSVAPQAQLAAPTADTHTPGATPTVTQAAPPAATGLDGVNNPGTANWSPYVADAAGHPLLERALVNPDPERPYAQAALVRIDLTRAQLHLVAGTREPLSPVRAVRPGRIPIADDAQLLAAFNGGFKAVNGTFGMAVGGITLLPPQTGLATLAIYRDGHVQMGVWGTDMRETPDMAAWRQNCPLLVDKGLIAPLAETDNAALWGKTVGNKVATWRSGLGLSADGHALIYAAGDGLTVPALAQALIDGGAQRAMQLDINSYWTRFVTYGPAASGHGLVAQKLLASMQGDTRQFLVPDSRDFFYVTALR